MLRVDHPQRVGDLVEVEELVQGAKGTVGALVRIVHAGDQPMWTRQLVGKVGVVVRNERVGHNRVYEVMVEGKIHRLHPLDVEAL